MVVVSRLWFYRMEGKPGTLNIPTRQDFRHVSINDSVVFKAEHWDEVKHYFQSGRVRYGICIGKATESMAEDLMEIPISLRFVKSITEISNGDDEHNWNISRLPVPVIVFNLEKLIERLKTLPDLDMVNFEQYLINNPDVVEELGNKIQIVDLNEYAVSLYDAQNKEEVIQYLSRQFHTYENSATIELIKILKFEKGTDLNVVTKIKTLRGTIKTVLVNWVSKQFNPRRNYSILVDLTFEKAIENQLKTELTRFYHFFDNIPLAVVVGDRKSKIKYVNQTFCKLLGYDKDELINRSMLEFTAPESIPENLRIAEMVISGMQEEAEYYKQYTQKNGQTILARVILKRSENPITGALDIVAVVENMTEQMVLNEAIEEGEKQYRSIFDLAPIGMVEISIDKQIESMAVEEVLMAPLGSRIEITSINREGYDVFRIKDIANYAESSLTEIAATANPKYFYSVLQEIIVRLEELKRGNHFEFTYRDEEKNQSYKTIVILVNTYPFTKYRVILFIADLTKEYSLINEYGSLNQFAKILADNEADIDSLFVAVAEFLGYEFNSHALILPVVDDRQYLFHTAFSPELGSCISVSDNEDREYIIQQEMLDQGEITIGTVHETIATFLDYSFEFQPKEDVCQLTFALIAEGKHEAIVILVGAQATLDNDITVKKIENFRESLNLTISKALLFRSLQNELDKRVQAERQLSEQAKALAMLNQDLEQFVFAASHDIQEPLRTISSYLDLIMTKIPENKELTFLMEKVVQATERLRNLIHSLRNYSTIGREELDFQEFMVSLPIQAAVNNLTSLILSRNAEVVFPNLSPSIYGNLSLMTNLFQNLISNAIKFNESDTPTVLISTEEKDAEIIIKIEDNGIGIKDEDLEKIFHVFKRLHPSSKYPGSGIGLATCQKIVSLHGGRIWVKSSTKGSTFFVALPKHQ